MLLGSYARPALFSASALTPRNASPRTGGLLFDVIALSLARHRNSPAGWRHSLAAVLLAWRSFLTTTSLLVAIPAKMRTEPVSHQDRSPPCPLVPFFLFLFRNLLMLCPQRLTALGIMLRVLCVSMFAAAADILPWPKSLSNFDRGNFPRNLLSEKIGG